MVSYRPSDTAEAQTSSWPLPYGRGLVIDRALARNPSIRTGLPGGSPQSHVLDMILERARRLRAACSGLPRPGDEAT